MAQIDFPENLRSAIIKNNRNLLNGKLPSYDRQIKKAQERGDIVSVNHRITAFLESYFDVIFALNRQTHPGEKRQVQLCKKYCTFLPKDFEENINALMKSISDGGSYEIVTAMVNNLDEILHDELQIKKRYRKVPSPLNIFSHIKFKWNIDIAFCIIYNKNTRKTVKSG